MDEASVFPDPRDVEVSVAAVHCTVEENVMKDHVSEFLVREHQLVREVDGWPACVERLFAKTLFFKRTGGNPADHVLTRFRRGGVRGVSASVSLKCQCLLFRVLTNRDQLLDVLVASTGVKSVDDGEAWPPEFAKYSATTVAEVVDRTVAKPVVEARPLRIEKYRVSAPERVTRSVSLLQLSQSLFLKVMSPEIATCRATTAAEAVGTSVAESIERR